MSSLKDQIINKVDNIYDTKQAIKRAIEDKGQTIEDDLSFYSYADKIRQITAMEGVVKLFETEEEMHSDSTAKEGDLAVVYRNEVQNMSINDQPQYLTFPESVTLPEALVNSVYCMLRSVDDTIVLDVQIMLNDTRFQLDCWGSDGYINVTYESSDGINYTRTIFTGSSGSLTNPVDLTTPIKVYYEEEWNDNLGYFMQIEGNYFGGLYKYQKGEDKDKLLFVSDIFADEDSFGHSTTISQYVTRQFINSGVFDKVLNNLPDNTVLNSLLVVTDYTYGYDNQDIKNIQCFAFTSPTAVDNLNKNTLYACDVFANGPSGTNQSYVMFKAGYEADDTTTDFKMYRWYFNEDEECILEEITDLSTFVWQKTDNTKYNKLCYSTPLNSYWDLYAIQYKNNEFDFYPFESQPYNGYGSHYIGLSFYEYEEYRIASNQYNLDNPNQLLPDVKAYGKNGNITGDGSIYNNLDLSQLFIANSMDIYKDSLVAIKENATGNKIKDVEPFTDGVGFITSNNTINELFKDYKVIRSKSYIIAYDNTTINLYDLNYNLLQTVTNSNISDLFLNSKLIYEDDNQIVHIGFSENNHNSKCYLVDLSKDGVDITYVNLSFDRVDLICCVGEDKEHNGYKYYVIGREEYTSNKRIIQAFVTTNSGIGYSKTVGTITLDRDVSENTAYCCFDDDYVYVVTPYIFNRLIVISKQLDTILNDDTLTGSSIHLCNNTGTCYCDISGNGDMEGIYKLNGTISEKISETKNIPNSSSYQFYYEPNTDNIISLFSGGNEVWLSTDTSINVLANFRLVLQPYYNGGTNSGIINSSLYLNNTKLEGLIVLFPEYNYTNGKVFNISVDFTKTLSNEGNINTLPINNGYTGNLVISQMNNTNYNNTLTPEQYLQALEKAKEIKGNKIDINGVVINE